MGLLGKDLLDFSRPQTNTKVQFGDRGYWVEDCPQQQPYGIALTQILNFDLLSFEKQFALCNKTSVSDDFETFSTILPQLQQLCASLPVYHLYLNDPFLSSCNASMDNNEPYTDLQFINDESMLSLIQKAISDIKLIQSRYTFFLDTLLNGTDFARKKGQKKISLADLMIKSNVDFLVSGVSLGASHSVDTPTVAIQYAVITPENSTPELVEKMYFNNLLDFVYVELMKGMQKGFIPKRCLNCGRWFLQQPGTDFNYCDQIAPGESGKSCREVGAVTSFKEKVKHNEVWQIHQRAYKKYFARTRKKTMSIADFEQWSRNAERLRDIALKHYASVSSADEKQMIADTLKEELNRL